MFFIRLLLLFLPFTLSAKNDKESSRVYFSPEDHLADKLIAFIQEEEKTIRVAAYAFSHWKIAKALCEAKERGVDVEIIVDPFSLQFSSTLKKMAKAKIPIWIWDPAPRDKQKKQPLMHDKFCVFGDRAVWTGSFNFTYYADRSNRENALFLPNKEIAKKFYSQFDLLKASGCRPWMSPSK